MSARPPAAPVRPAIPMLPIGMVARDTLTKRLDRLAPLTVIQALDGHGKTTLASAWARQLCAGGVRVVWLEASTAIATPYDLLATLMEALAANDGVPVRTGGPHDIEELMGVLRAELAIQPGPVVVVIDEAQIIDDPIVDGLMIDLLTRGTLRLVLCTNGHAPVVGRARGLGLDINLLTARHLVAGVTAIPEFAAAWGHTVDRAHAEELHALTGGWLVPMRMVLDNSPPDLRPLAMESARNFFSESVLPQVVGGAGIDVLVRLAVPGELSVAMVAVLTADLCHETPLRCELSASDIISQLARTGLLEQVSSDERVPHWRLPVLVRRMLLEHLEDERPQLVRGVNRIVLRMLLASPGRVELGAVLVHARRGEDWDTLARLWTEKGTILPIEYPGETAQAYDNLPEQVLAEHPSLALAGRIAAAVLFNPRDPKHRIAVRRYMSSGGRALANLTDYPSADQMVLAGAAAMILLRSRGEWSRARAFAARIASDLERRELLGDLLHGRQLAWFQMQRGLGELLVGNSDDAVEMITVAYELAGEGTVDYIASTAAGHLALVHALRGRTRQAHRWLDAHRDIDTSGHWLQHVTAVPARGAAALLAIDVLDLAAADRELDGLEQRGEQTEFWAPVRFATTQRALLGGQHRIALIDLDRIDRAYPSMPRDIGMAGRVLDRCRADLLLAAGQLNRAARIVDDAGARATWLQVPAARLRLIAGDPGLARQIASQAVWDRRTSLRDCVDLLLIEAAAALAMGDEEPATTTFAHAHQLAVEHCLVASMASIPAATLEALLNLTVTRLDPLYAARLGSIRPVYPEGGELVALSPREQTVLHQMTRCNTVPEIAQALTVSVNTVKKQAVSIYAKLGVHDRAAALQRAAQLGIVDCD